MENIFTSTEFYVIAITFGIILCGFLFHPSQKGEAETYFFNALLTPCEECDEHSLSINVRSDGTMEISHSAIKIPIDGNVSIAMTIIGNDLKIIEKQIPEPHDSYNVYRATFLIDKLKPNCRYHLYYENPINGVYATASIRTEYPFASTVEFHR